MTFLMIFEGFIYVFNKSSKIVLITNAYNTKFSTWAYYLAYINTPKALPEAFTFNPYTLIPLTSSPIQPINY